MQKLTPELLSEERLKKFVDEETFLLGLNLYQKKRVKILELLEQKADCVVNDTRPQKVEIQLTTSHLLLKCNCPHGNRGLVCEHGVASWLFVRDHLRQNDFPQWRQHLSAILEHVKGDEEPKKALPYLLFFSLQTNHASSFSFFNCVPYILPLSTIDKQLQQTLIEARPGEITQIIHDHPHLGSRLRIPNTALNVDGCINQSRQMVILANVMVNQERYFYSSTSLDDYLLIFSETQTPIYFGDSQTPFDCLAELILHPGMTF